jgi:hypothetical protein
LSCLTEGGAVSSNLAHSLADFGLDVEEYLGGGVEGHVFAFAERVVKVWFDATPQRLGALQGFYDVLQRCAGSGLH